MHFYFMHDHDIDSIKLSHIYICVHAHVSPLDVENNKFFDYNLQPIVD